MPEVRAKICGLTRVEDARAAEEAGAAFVGVILARGFDRTVEPRQAVEIGRSVGIPLVTVRVDEPFDLVVEEARSVGAGVVQLHGVEPPDLVRRLKEVGDWEVWKSVRVRSVGDAVEAFEAYRGVADGVLLDGWHPGRAGGTGRTFSWTDVSRVRSGLPEGTALIAAGGLTVANVSEAVRLLRPDIVDVSSGVESEVGIKDHAKVRAFIEAAGAAPAAG